MHPIYVLFQLHFYLFQIKNNYQIQWEIKSKHGIVVDKGLGVFNGDIGIIKEINDFSETVIVEFDDSKIVEYKFTGLDELEHAYAITIHKSQGKTFDKVNLDPYCWDCGQLYVAMSRVRTIQGLHLTQYIGTRFLVTSADAQLYYSKIS